MTNMFFQGGQTGAREPHAVFGSLNATLLTRAVFVCSNMVLGCATCSATRLVVWQVEGCTCVVLGFKVVISKKESSPI